MSNPTLNNQLDHEIKVVNNSVNFLLSTNTNTAKIIESPYATGQIIIETFIIHDSKSYAIQEIDDKAFFNAKIESISFRSDSQIKRIGNNAFQKSTIKIISIPDSLETFGEYWCYEVTNLTNIIINPEHKHFRYENGLLTTKDRHEIIFARRDLPGSPIFPTNITKILPSAFYSCKEVTSLRPNSSNIKYIGSNAFFKCEKLNHIKIIGENIDLTIGEKCFFNCSLLSNIFISCNSLTLGDFCFECCTSIMGLNFSIKKISIGQNCFSGCVNISSISIPNSDFIEIKSKGFLSLIRLDSIFMKTNEYEISNDSFKECNSLKSLYFNAKNNVNSEIFWYLDKLKEIDLTSLSTLEIENYSFDKMSYLESIRLRSKNLILKENCFKNLKNISSIIIESENQINLMANLFEGCKALKKFQYTKAKFLNFSEKIVLDENCFPNKENLEEIIIEANDIILSKNCFSDSKKLQKVVLRGKNIVIGEYCFNGCDSLKSIIITQLDENIVMNEIKLEKECFSNAKNLEEFVLKANDINLGESCFSGSKKLQKVALHGKKIVISENCFNGCDSLKSFIITELDESGIINEIKLAEKCLFKAVCLEIIEIKANDINLGPSCFSGSQKLQKVVLQGKKIIIGENCFTECDTLKSFIVSKLNNNEITEEITLEDQCFLSLKNLEEIEITANNICFNRSCFKCSKKLQKILLNGKKIIIGDNCFSECDLLKSFTITESEVTGILEEINLSKKCFFNSKSLEVIEIVAKVICFDSSCFGNSRKLRNVSLHCINITIGGNCFTECNSIKTFTINELNKNENVNEINLLNECFFDSKGLREIVIKAKKINILNNCFKGANKLQKILIDGTTVNLSDYCFNNCSSLQSFTINSLISISIGSKQFIECAKLKEITINATNNNDKDSNNSNNNNNNDNNNDNNSEIVGKKIELAYDCLKGANNLEILNICGGQNLKISNELLNSSSISTLKIESFIKVIFDSNLFNDSKKLQDIYINSGNLIIKDNCFNGNQKLKHVILNCPIIDIKTNCFNNINYCNHLEFNNSDCIDFYSNDFCNWNNLSKIELSAFSSLNIGQHCFCKSMNLKSISFYSKKVSIGSESFQECSSLQSVNFIQKVVINLYNKVSVSLAPKLEKIENIFIGEKSFNLCKNMKELNIDAINSVYVCKECFYNLSKLYTIKIKALQIDHGTDSFYHCPGFQNITSINKPEREITEIKNIDIQKKMNIKKDYKKSFDNKPLINNLSYKNERKFNSFFVLGYCRGYEKPSFISMFPSKPVTLSDDNIDSIRTYCFPQGKKPVPSNLTSNIINGFVFYIGEREYIGVALHISIPHSANSFVGNGYDRSYPFCICLVSNNPDIASHFSFLYDVVDPIVGKIILDEEEVEIPECLQNQEGNCFELLHDKTEYIALAPFAYSMCFLLPKLVKYYENKDLKKYIQNEYLLYPTLQSLFSFLSPEKIIKLFFCMICEFKMVFISNDLNKLSFCVIALTNLIKGIYINNVIPCFPVSNDNESKSPFPYIFGYNKKCENDDVDINLDTGKIDFNSEQAKSIVNNFPYLKKLVKDAEELFNENSRNFEIPIKNSLKSEFLKNADKSIYPDCFQYFVQSKYIFTISFIRDFVKMIEKPFFLQLNSFTEPFLVTDTTEPEEPVTIFDQGVFLFHVDELSMEFMNIFIHTQVFEQIKEKNEKQRELAKTQSEAIRKDLFIRNKAHISSIINNSKHKRRNSYPISHKKSKSMLKP